MKLISGIIFAAFIASLSAVLAIEDRHRHRHRHGHGHGHRHGHGHHRRHRHHDTDDEDWNEDAGKHSWRVHKHCKRSGMVALTFDDGVV